MMLKDFVELLPECTLMPIFWFILVSLFGVFQPSPHKNGTLSSSPHKLADQLLFAIQLSQTLDSASNTLVRDQVLTFLGKTSFPEAGPLLSCKIIEAVSDAVSDGIQQLIGHSPNEALSFTRVYHGRSESVTALFVCSPLYGTIEAFYLINTHPLVTAMFGSIRITRFNWSFYYSCYRYFRA